MKVIRGIAFDLEGPIFDFEQLHFASHIGAVQQVLRRNISYEWILEYVPNAIGGGDHNIALHIAREFSEPHCVDPLLQAKRTLFETELHDRPIQAREGAVRTINWFRENGYRVAIGSNTPRDAAMRYLGSIGLASGIPIVLAEDVANPKPWPDVYQKTAKLMGISPWEQLVFDDSGTGLEAAMRAGSPRIATPLHRTPSVMEKLEQYRPLRIIHSWDEIVLKTLMSHIGSELQILR